MPGDMIEIVQTCSICFTDLGTVEEKKENMMLSKNEEMWCEKCGSHVLSNRDVVGRNESIAKEIESYPPSMLPKVE